MARVPPAPGVTHIVAKCLQPALSEKFATGLEDLVRIHWPDLGSVDVPLGRFNARILLRGPGYEIKPHRDPRWAFLTCLMYFPQRDQAQAFGTQLCRLRQEREAPSHSPFYVDPDECELVREVPGIANTALVFLNSTGAHRASIPNDVTPDTERYLYQLQLGPQRELRQSLLERLPREEALQWSEKTLEQSHKR
ncbi:MAG: hypothetical protein ABGY72_10290 [bacterium]